MKRKRADKLTTAELFAELRSLIERAHHGEPRTISRINKLVDEIETRTNEHNGG